MDGSRKTRRLAGETQANRQSRPSPLRAYRTDKVPFKSFNPRIPARASLYPWGGPHPGQGQWIQLINGCDCFPGLPKSPTGGRLQREVAIRQSRVGWSDHFFAPVAGRVQAPCLHPTDPGRALPLTRPSGPDCPSPHIFRSKSYTRIADSSLCSFFGPPFEQN